MLWHANISRTQAAETAEKNAVIFFVPGALDLDL